MLTLEEIRWSLHVFKIFSILNIFPIQVDVTNGKIQKQSNQVKIFIWKLLFGLWALNWLYMFVRLVQSTIVEPEKYFRWDHFVLHFPCTCAYAIFYFTQFCIFVKGAEENVIIFNYLFAQREDPVQKMMHQQLEMKTESKSGTGQQQGNKSSGKSGAQLVSTSARESHDKIQGPGQNQVIENRSGYESEVSLRARPLLVWPLQYSLAELISKLLPLIFMFTGFFIVLFLAADPSRSQLLYSSLPSEYQSIWSFLILLAVEAFFMTILFAIAGYSVVVQVLFFDKCQLEFERISLQLRNLREKFQNHSLKNRQIEREMWILRQILEEMRELIVLVELFNRCFPFVIFGWKLYSLCLSIDGYFFLVRHAQDFPVLAVFMGYSATCITLVYTIMYKHAFSIPGKMDDLKNEFLLTAQKTTTMFESNANSNSNVKKNSGMKSEMKRIRNVGIKVGSFHQMERESTPIFVDFVVNQVVSLLVTFPQ